MRHVFQGVAIGLAFNAYIFGVFMAQQHAGLCFAGASVVVWMAAIYPYQQKGG